MTPTPVTGGAPAHPFDADGIFVVLVNDQGQHSLWPLFADVPEGWTVTYGPCPRQDALEWLTARDAGAPAQ
ncbi:MbtH family protein [Streptomyces sp. NPDC059063]|uniref:MbtH family protein n=1 Tax=unclassified Streptomyces TaxID=2593676 RepID=UPI003696B1A2